LGSEALGFGGQLARPGARQEILAPVEQHNPRRLGIQARDARDGKGGMQACLHCIWPLEFFSKRILKAGGRTEPQPPQQFVARAEAMIDRPVGCANRVGDGIHGCSVGALPRHDCGRRVEDLRVCVFSWSWHGVPAKSVTA
jgi:hypothetical protein